MRAHNVSVARSRLPRLLQHELRSAITPQVVAIAAVAVSAVMLLVQLAAFPPFIDELIYVGWAARLAESPSLDTLWLSVTEDWKTPGHTWATALANAWFRDPILSGRLVAAFSGVLTIGLVYHAGRRLVGAWPAAIAAAILAVSPALIFTGRLALADVPIVMLAALTWSLAVPAARGHLPGAIGAGLVVALAFWTKMNGALLLIIPVTGVVLARSVTLRRRVMVLALGAAPLSVAYGALLLVPKSAQVFEGTARFVLTPDRLIEFPVDQWIRNLAQMGDWALAYLPGVSIVAGAAALLVPFFTRRREDWWLWAVLVCWLAFYALLGSILFSRYLLPVLVPFALLAARAITVIGARLRLAGRARLASTWMVGASAAVVLSLAIPAVLVVAAPTHAALPDDDRAQYIEQWSAGFGQVEALQWIADTSAAEPGPAIVLTHHKRGAPGDFATVMLRRRTDLAVYVENRIRHPAGGVADAWQGHGVPVYALINGNHDDGDEFLRLNPEFTPVAAFERPGAKSTVTVLEFRPA